MIQSFSLRRIPAILLLSLCALALSRCMADAATPAGSPTEVFLAVPKTVHDGEPFACTAYAAGASSFLFEFRGKKITVPAEAPAPQSGDTRKQGLVLLSIPLEHKTKRETLRCTALGPDKSLGATEATLTVAPKKYPVQRLKVAPKYVTPDPALKPRIERERNATRAALGTFSPVRYWTLPLHRPTPGIVTSEYGLRRVFNGQPRNPHMGVDFRAAEGTPIECVADGKVILTGDFYYAGRNVIVDHGLGVLSTYMHLSEISVKEGQMLRRGDLVGLAGSTGRVTGPHLHLSFTVLGSSVSAKPLFEARPKAGRQ